MIINHNMPALNAHRQLGVNATNHSKSMEKLSSGLRINRAGDDAAGLAISEKMRGQIRGLDQASRNAQDGISLIQTAEGSLSETHAILQRMRELSVQSGNDTNTDADRTELNKEVKELQKELNRISSDTEFNTKTLMNGDLQNRVDGMGANTAVSSVTIHEKGTIANGGDVKVSQTVTHGAESATGAADGAFEKVEFEFELEDGSTATVEFTKAELEEGKLSKEITVGDAKLEFTLDATEVGTMLASQGNGAAAAADDTGAADTDNSLTFQVGANSGQSIELSIGNMSAKGLNVDSDKVDISTKTGASDAIKSIDAAIANVSGERAKLGAVQNRLEHTIKNLGASSENLTAAESRIRDVDMAKEMMNSTKSSILSQAAQAMLAQANQQPQQVLQLLR